MEFDFRGLATFVELAEELSFTRAAERLGITQPQLSIRLRALEERLGFLLFERSSRRVRLTYQGEQLLPRARKALDQLDGVNQQARAMKSGLGSTIRVGVSDYGRALRRRILNRFMALNSSTTVDVELIRDGTETRIGLAAGRWDIAMLPETEPLPPLFDTIELASLSVGLIVPEGSLLSRAPEVDLDALRGQPVALFRRDLSPSFHDRLADLLAPADPRILHLPEASEDGVLEYVREWGTPVLCACWWVTEPDRPDGLVHRAISGRSFKVPYLAARRREPASRSANQLWGLARRMGTIQPALLTGSAEELP